MGRLVVIAAMGLAGCSQIFGLESPVPPSSDATVDGPPSDSAPDTPPGQTCFGSGLITVCFADDALPATTLTVTGTIDTDMACPRVQAQSNGPEVCVYAGLSVSFTGAVRVVGSRPAVFVSRHSMAVQSAATIDVSSKTGSPGAGSNFASCVVHDGVDASNAPTGGGAGGAMSGLGGAGGNGSGAGSTVGGAVTAVVPVTHVRGGCIGGSGGMVGAMTGAAGGAGGGAIYLIAGVGIDMRGTLNASGAQGAGGPSNGRGGGGGGGGSGGLIAFDAPMVTIESNAAVFANGGGGGGGADKNVDGQPGGVSPSALMAAAGGAGASAANNGGVGSVGENLAGNTGGSGNGNGGGGGGGGAGLIRIFATSQTVTSVSISPAPT